MLLWNVGCDIQETVATVTTLATRVIDVRGKV